MANWSQSHILQSLGWATLNSFWQMALLWCLFLACSHLFKLSSQRKYQFSVISILTGFAWFVFTFIFYYNNPVESGLGFLDNGIKHSGSYLNILLISASMAYLSLLIFPSYKLYRNWRFVQTIKKEGLSKANFNIRLFVQKISSHLGISRIVTVYVSNIVRSPLTVGYLKPIILLPLAAINNLSTQQVEAILLHELSHIRRYDYLFNFMISIISTILYFNPFIKMFMRSVEEERENCCDQLVLQYGYDKIEYATALLTLEKLSVHSQVLALAATGKNFLLNRIEKIVGLEGKKQSRKNHLAGMLAALFCIFAFNSVLIIKETRNPENGRFAFSSVSSPFNLFENNFEVSEQPAVKTGQENTLVSLSPLPNETMEVLPEQQESEEVLVMEVEPLENTSHLYAFIASDDIDASLTKEQKEEVKETVENTRKVISGLQWSEIEKTIADVLSDREKILAKEEYMKALEKTVDFHKLEQNLKARYAEVDLARINANLDKAITMIQLDSIQKNYNEILVQLEKAKVQASQQAEVAVSPLPDQSLEMLKRYSEEIRKKMEIIDEIRSNKKVIRL